jgi:hypothetical protein
MVEIMVDVLWAQPLTDLNQWRTTGTYHRIDGPCIVWTGGDEWWYFKGERLAKENHPFNIFRKDYNLSETYEKWSDDMKMLFKLTYGG